MDRMTFYFRQPFYQTMTRAIELIHAKPTPPSDSKKRGMFEKVAFVASCLFYTSIIPLSLLLLGIAGVIDSLKGGKYTYWRGESKGKAGDPKTFFSWNVCMLFGGLSIPFGGVVTSEKRIAVVAEKVLKVGADIVCLQEVSGDSAKRLYDRLKKHYKHFYVKINPDPWLTLDSSLFIASNVEVHDPLVTPLSTAGRIKRALFSFKTASLHVATTHLEPGEKESDRLMRIKQAAEILKVLPCKQETVLLGDLNIERGREFRESGLNQRFFDGYAPENGPTALVDQSIDYILTSKKGGLKVQKTNGYQMPHWADSDHHGLLGRL